MPEKSAQQVPRALRDMFDKGKTASDRENYDYALSIFNAVLDKEPGFFECRQQLRVAQHRKAEKERGFFKKMFGGASAGGLAAKGQLALRRNPNEALGIAEQILNSDPKSTMGHKLLVEAAIAAGLPNTAIFSLEILLKNDPRDRKLREHMADACLLAGDVERAEGVLQELENEFPNDPNLKQKLKNMSAQKTLDQGYDKVEEEGTTFRDLLKDKEEAQLLEVEHREVKNEDQAQRLMSQYEARLKHEPKNHKIRRELARLYTEKNRFDEALAAYDEIKRSEVGNDPSLDSVIAETVLRRFNHQIAQLDPAAPDHEEQRAKIEKERQEYQIAECKQRADRFPTDLNIRFELGELYFVAGRLGEAIAELQKAQKNPNRRIPAMKLLGQSYALKNMPDLAAITLRNALREKQVFDAEQKDLRYALGGVLEKLGKSTEAIEEYKLIYAEDSEYKDVAAKVDKFYSGGQ